MESSQAAIRREVQLQGPKPVALMVNRNSTKIKKQQKQVPVIVHLRSPKVIHVKPEEFMGLVQHLTGNPVSAPAPAAPAAASSMEPTLQKLELIRSPVAAIDHNQLNQEEDFMRTVVGPGGLSIDFHALM